MHLSVPIYQREQLHCHLQLQVLPELLEQLEVLRAVVRHLLDSGAEQLGIQALPYPVHRACAILGQQYFKAVRELLCRKRVHAGRHLHEPEQLRPLQHREQQLRLRVELR